MALTPSKMIDLGTKAPTFNLPDTVSGNTVDFEDIRSDVATVIMFICNHCPYVIHVNEELVRLGNDYTPLGVSFVAISSNDVENYPADSPEKMKYQAKKLGYPFPYLYDESQEIAGAYDAACTPDFYVFDGENRLAYRGRLDGSRPNTDIPVTGVDLRSAIDSVISKKPVTGMQYPSMGCGIKWKREKGKG